MSEMENNKINEEQLDNVAGGNDGRGEGTYSAYDISPRWIRVTVAKVYKRGDRLKVDGITTDGKWYRFWMYDPKGGECNGYIFKAYTELD